MVLHEQIRVNTELSITRRITNYMNHSLINKWGGVSMIKYLTHYYKAGTTPFRSLSVLPEKEAIKIMKELYVDNSIFSVFIGL